MDISKTGDPQCDRDLLDHDVLVERCMGNHDLVQRLLSRYAQSGGQDCDMLESALHAQDPNTLATVAHRIKGSAATIGSNRVSRLAARIEQESPSADWGTLETMIDDLRRVQKQVGDHCHKTIESYAVLKDNGGDE